MKLHVITCNYMKLHIRSKKCKVEIHENTLRKHENPWQTVFITRIAMYFFLNTLKYMGKHEYTLKFHRHKLDLEK